MKERKKERKKVKIQKLRNTSKIKHFETLQKGNLTIQPKSILSNHNALYQKSHNRIKSSIRIQ